MASTVTVRLMERKSNRPIAEVTKWVSLEWTQRLRRFGTGQLVMRVADLPRAALTLIMAGNAGIYASRETERQLLNGETERLVDEVWGRIGSFEVRNQGGDYLVFLPFADDLVYLDDRVVETAGAATVSPGTVTGIEYVRYFINRELIAPTDGDRAIDVPAKLAGLTAGGGSIRAPVRWKRLSDVCEAACYLTDIGMRASVNSSLQIEFSAFPLRDRTEGSANAVIINEANTGATIALSSDWRAVRNRVVVLGANEAAARDVRRVTDSASRLAVGLRELVIDARNLGNTTDYDHRGNTELAERLSPAKSLLIEGDLTYDVRPGDIVTVSEYLLGDSVVPDIGPEDVTCVSRHINLRPGSPDQVTVDVGIEPIDIGSILRGQGERTEEAQFE